jgi:adenine-specific DNA methylase
MNSKEQRFANKLRGGYYTPPIVALFLAKWVMSKRPRTILEPSCGDGAFVQAFQGLHRHTVRLTGIELFEEEAIKARNRAKDNDFLQARVLNEDFLAWAIERLKSGERYDAVIGNPPYIRYQYLKAGDQELAERIFEKYDLVLTKHANAWVPFVIACAGLLSPGGRLAMVIPSEVLHVLYAAPVRKFLVSECRRILIIDPRALLFSKTLQGTVMLMAEKKSSRAECSEGVSLMSAAGKDFLIKDPEPYFEKTIYTSAEGKWTKLLLSPAELAVFNEARAHSLVRRFEDIASVDLGILTGSNKYFVVDRQSVLRHDLSQFARPMLAKSEHCPGVIYDGILHRENEAKGLPTSLICFGKVPVDVLPPKVREYIALGELQKLHMRYKCRVRTPWYSVPSVHKTPVGMVKCSHDYHRLFLNSADAYTTTTAYRVSMVSPEITPALLVFSFINSLTALSAELEGRSYGGGVLELVPSEIEKLLVPIVGSIEHDLKALNAKIKSGMDADVLLLEQDKMILTAAGFTGRERALIHEAWDRTRARRLRIERQDRVDEETKES